MDTSVAAHMLMHTSRYPAARHGDARGPPGPAGCYELRTGERVDGLGLADISPWVPSLRPQYVDGGFTQDRHLVDQFLGYGRLLGTRHCRAELGMSEPQKIASTTSASARAFPAAPHRQQAQLDRPLEWVARSVP